MWSQNLPFPIDLARGPYNSAALGRCLWQQSTRDGCKLLMMTMITMTLY